jgi:Ser-tRNA(Ala) deacylase AlaX
LKTQKLFWYDPYRCELDTQVTNVNDNRVEVAETIFYAFSGGQESDTGFFNEFPVLDAHKDQQTIVYTLPADHGLVTGEQVSMRIDWDRRYRLMRLHFAAELILELVNRTLPGIEKIGAHIAADKARIDFASEDNLSSHFTDWEQQARQIAQADRAIVSAFSDENAQRRYWEVEGFARVPCGGTHLKSTSEVGEIRLKRKNIGKGKERIEIYLTDL